MTYTLNFTNTTSIAEFTISSNMSTVTILFSGTRYQGDGNSSTYRPADGFYGNRVNTIALADPRAHPLPHFTFANGSEIKYSYDKSYGWIVSAVSASGVGPRVSLALLLVSIGSITVLFL
jgi:hypothetical protein